MLFGMCFSNIFKLEKEITCMKLLELDFSMRLDDQGRDNFGMEILAYLNNNVTPL